MKVLVACEESQRVCIAFRERGHEAYSCDLEDCSGGRPEWHIKGDALIAIRGGQVVTMDGATHDVGRWDLIIAHPPCTYMSNAGACRMYPRKGVVDSKRLEKAMEAKAFFMSFLTADCDKICIENPMPMKIIGLPKETQRIQPYMFGDPYSKKTYLWIKGLRELQTTNVCKEHKPYLPSATGRRLGGETYGVARSAKERSKTFPGIAKAMAEQWG